MPTHKSYKSNNLLQLSRTSRCNPAAPSLLHTSKPAWTAILPYETSDVRKQNFFVRLPIEVLVVSTSEFLFGLQCL